MNSLESLGILLLVIITMVVLVGISFVVAWFVDRFISEGRGGEDDQ